MSLYGAVTIIPEPTHANHHANAFSVFFGGRGDERSNYLRVEFSTVMSSGLPLIQVDEPLADALALAKPCLEKILCERTQTGTGTHARTQHSTQQRTYPQSERAFIHTLVHVLSQVLRDKEQRIIGAVPKILGELSALGWDHIHKIDPRFRTVDITCMDKNNRTHVYVVDFPDTYPLNSPLVSVNLPFPLDLRWHSHASVSDIHAQVIEHANKFCDFCEVIDDIDTHTHVLEPVPPSYAVHMRRIAVSRNCSIELQIDVTNPKSYCPVRFFGAEDSVQTLRASLNSNILSWDSSVLPRINLETILGITFPSPQSSTREGLTTECAICYSDTHTDTGEAGLLSSSDRDRYKYPDEMCGNPKCGRAFHRRCLLAWLQSLPTTRTSFDTVFGACPYCSSAMSLDVAT